MAEASIVRQESTRLPYQVIFKQLTPDRLMVQIGGGVKDVLFGTAFLLPGLAIMLIGFHIVSLSGENFMINGAPLFGLFGLPFFLAGSAIICYRRWLLFDLGRGELVIEFGLLTPMFRRARSLVEFTSVTIELQVQSTSGGDTSQSSGYYSYPVVLTTGTHGNALTVNNRATYPQAYSQAATIAKFLGLPVRDQSTDHPVEITPDDLSHPLRTRLREDTAQKQLAAPAKLRSHVDESSSSSRIIIPGKTNNSRIDSFMPFVATAALIILLIILRIYFKSAHLPVVLQYWMMGLVVLFGGVPILVMLKNDWIDRHTSLVVSVKNQGIRVEERCGKRTRYLIMFPIEEIIDIDYSIVEDRRKSRFSGRVLRKIIGSKGIILKTKIGLYTFGAGLPDAEIEYLALVVEKALRLVLIQSEKLKR